ncbi:TPA: hypothetical protein DEB00_01410 [Candidatus Uhrbacteria bacterium]|nr:hypothetical protein [Candidatus Uhrbacteria bacterium]
MQLSKQQLGYILAGVVGVVAIGVVILILVNVKRSHQPLSILVNQMEASKDRVDNARIACESEQDPVICLRQAVIMEAKQIGSVEVCSTLEEPDASTCVETIALDTQNREACRSLGEERRNVCEDSVTLQIAREQKDFRLCEGIQDVTVRETCTSSITSEVIVLDLCVEYGVQPEACDSMKRFQQAVETGDLTFCDTYEEEDARLDCLEAVGEVSTSLEEGTVDTDQDGLDDAREERLGTNPNRADTDGDGLPDGDEVDVYFSQPLIADSDGDGFLDGTEVRNGFDPNGPGSL